MATKHPLKKGVLFCYYLTDSRKIKYDKYELTYFMKISKSKLAALPSFGMTVVGERGQIVIPKEMRDLLALKKGDQLMLMFHNDSVVIIPREKMEMFVHHLTTNLKLNPKPKK